MFDANNFGAFTYTGATGWQNQTLTLESDTARFRHTILDADTFTDDWEVRKPGSTDWTPADHLVCRRLA